MDGRGEGAWTAAGAALGASHLALIGLLVAGGPVAVRHPGIAKVHVPALVATGAVFLAGADCPLTVWQKACIRNAGGTPYPGGFIEHHLTRREHTASVSALVLAAWVVPTAVGYALALRRARHQRVRSPGAPALEPRARS